MAQSHNRKTIRKNPLDALGSKPISMSAPSNPRDSHLHDDVVEDMPAQGSKPEARSDGIRGEPKTAAPAEDAPQVATSQPVQRKNVEALFDEVLSPSVNNPRKRFFKTTMGKQTASNETNVDPQALAIVKTWSQWAALGGTVPAPVVDVALISAAQVKMLHLLCKHYRIPFEKKMTLSLVTSLVGGSAPTWLAQTIARTSIKSVPLVGSVVSLATQPALAFATTYAIGRTFVEHFEARGTLLNFSADKMSGAFSRFFHAGRSLFKAPSP